MKEELIGTQEASLGSWRGPFHLLKEMRSWEELCPEVGPTIGIEGQSMFTHLLPETFCQGCHPPQSLLPTLLRPGDLASCWSLSPEEHGGPQQDSP